MGDARGGQVILLDDVLRDALLHGTTPRPKNVAREGELENLGKPEDRPVIRQGTITAINVSQPAFPSNSLRKSFLIQNPSTNLFSLFARLDGDPATTVAGESIEILPGASLGDSSDSVTQSVISVISAGIISFYREETSGT